jgi:signal transduction histidine kinase
MVQMVRLLQDERIERERLAAIGEMVRRIVHNVRNPLSGIRGLAEVTRFDFEKGTPNRENMDLIVSTVDTFERWLSELLDATSPASIHPRRMPVADWISGIVEIHRSQAVAKNVLLTLDAAAAPHDAVFDPAHMDHAVSALISNAIEAAPEGGKVWVTARSAPLAPHAPPASSAPSAPPAPPAPDSAAWDIEVVDNGRGISAEVLPRIFDLQFTTKRHGSGLGLAMAQQIIRGHAGRISVRNGDERHPERCGACFIVRLPVQADAVAPPPNKEQSSV